MTIFSAAETTHSSRIFRALRACLGPWLVALAVLAAASTRAHAAQLEQLDGLSVCVIDLAVDEVRVFYTDQQGLRFGTIEALRGWLARSHEDLVCATNGGIFGTDGAPLGWLVADGVVLHGVNRDTSSPGNFFLQPNGALVIDAQGARVVPTAAIAASDDVAARIPRVAVQSGPLLVVAGAPSARLDPASHTRYRRNGTCTRDDRHLLLIYSATPVTLFAFAQSLVRLGCRDGLYLDGHLSVFYPGGDGDPGERPLSTFIAVTKKDSG